MQQRQDLSAPKRESRFIAEALSEPPCPFFLLDPHKLSLNAAGIRSAVPGADVLYALKANPDPEVIRTLSEAGCGFEAASWFEIEHVLSLGMAASRIVFGTAVKQRSQVERAYRAGVSRFAADSAEELHMLAAAAPSSSVFVRAKLDDRHSIFRLNEKFGAPVGEIVDLLLLARRVGLVPWGVSFNVGSQATRADAWARGIETVAPIFWRALTDGIRLEVLNIGGGFPVPYLDHPEISSNDIASSVREGMCALPYAPRLVVEPGRGLVGTAMQLVASVIARIDRLDATWLFLDCGVYNALYEALLHQGRTAYPVSALGPHDVSGPTALFTLAGPTGDGLDVIARKVALPAGLAVGDRLLFENVGAYTHCMASTFNGFPIPPIRILGAE